MKKILLIIGGLITATSMTAQYNAIGLYDSHFTFSKAAFNPLLHLWSLGVEIQFYLIVPLLFWFFRKNKLILPTTIIISLVLCLVFVGISAKTSFFMMPMVACCCRGIMC